MLIYFVCVQEILAFINELYYRFHPLEIQHTDVELKFGKTFLLMLCFILNRGMFGSLLVCGVVGGSKADGK